MKSVQITDVAFSTTVTETFCGTSRVPDPFVVFKSHRVTVGRREDFRRRTTRPTFPGPYVVSFGGSEDAEQLAVELWRYEPQGADELLEQVTVDFSGEATFGRRTWRLSREGSVALTWRLSRPERADAARRLRLRVPAVESERYLLVTGESVDTQERWDSAQLEPRELLWDEQGYVVELWRPDAAGDVLLAEGVLHALHASLEESSAVVELSNGDRLEFSYTVSGAGAEPPPLVVRKEIRLLAAAEQQRFLAALRKLFENTEGAQSSEFFRLAAHHGWPEDFCAHGQENFPAWHRAYLYAFERRLVQADLDLGNDGNLGLPYWDWTTELNGQVLPSIIREHFSELPDGLVDPAQAGRLASQGFQLPSEEQLRENLRAMQVTRQAAEALATAEHWLFASTRSRGFSVESPHNGVHVALGFPMSTVPYAAFHPIFFLHHSNVDRIYEKHVQMETPEECAMEFAARQRTLAQQGEPNRFLQALEPFEQNGRPLMPAETFNTTRLGYVYDELPPSPRALDADLVYAAFNIEAAALKKSYALHVFLGAQGGSAPSSFGSSWRQARQADGYAGAGAVFGGREHCSNCETRPPFTVLVEVGETLRRLHLSRHDAQVHVICEDEMGATLPLEETPIPPPVLVGSWFEDESTLHPHSSGPEVMQLQRALQKLGYFTDVACTGVYDASTVEAVKDFQKFTGLSQDGVAGPQTKAALVAKRFDNSPDIGGPSKGVRRLAVSYAVGALPGYLERRRGECLAEIHQVFEQWSAAGVKFQRSSELHAQLEVSFAPLPLGQLAEASAQGIVLDSAERWLLRSQTKPQRFREAFYLFPVLLHEVGHFLGLPHSRHESDAMWPYYREELRVSDADKAALRGLGDCCTPCVVA